MQSHFYHLKFELYTQPPASTAKRALASKDVFLPAPGSDVFATNLPTHRSSPWNKDSLGGRHSRQASSDSGSPRPASRSQPGSAGQPDVHGDALLLPERNLALREAPSPALSPAKPSSEAAARDWRFERISIDSVDMEQKTDAVVSRERGKSVTSGKTSLSGLHTRGTYFPLELKTTDVGWGIVHLYKDSQEQAALDVEDNRFSRQSVKTHDTGHFDMDKCTTLCILAVPSWMMPSDLLGFVGDQTREDVSHFRLIRTERANKYMVLMKFRQAKKAREWQKAWNGRLFSAMEPENCHVVFIQSVEFLTPESHTPDAAVFPQNNLDPFTPSGQLAYNGPLTSSMKPFAPPTPSLIELPTCPVCLERMDETTGLLTILCQHVFHCACLEKWRGSGCPVCRYTQSPSFTFPYPRPTGSSQDVDSEPACSVCASESNLWICLICGSIGCGRYDSAHAFAHYEGTSHCYAMDITSQHVWDYAGDGYVHRLIQNKENSKLIDLPARQGHPNNAFRAEGEDSVPREKMEAMANEYTYLLTSQLEGQRRYFEEQLERAVDKASTSSARAEQAALRAEEASAALEAAKTQQDEYKTTIYKLEKAVAKASVRADKFEKMAREMSKQAREEKTMNEGLVARIQAADQKVKERAEEVEKMKVEKAELEDMNRDLTIFISSQEKVRELQEQGEEVVDGTVSVPEQSASGGKKKGKGRKKG